MGDPEQFIQSFNSSVTSFSKIAIMKVINGTTYDVQLNTLNHRCSEAIVKFLNNFNKRVIKGSPFFQESKTGVTGSAIRFLSSHGEARPIIEQFNAFCVDDSIAVKDRCIIAKKNDIVGRIVAAVDNRFTPPTRIGNSTPIKSVIDNLLSAVGMNQGQFCTSYRVDVHTLRKYAIAVLKAIRARTIHDVNSYANFLVGELKLTLKTDVPIKIENIRAHFTFDNQSEVVTVSNIHLIKGLEAEAVLAIAKTQKELLLWIEIDQDERDKNRRGDDNDYPRLGYVAFSRAKKLLCIACLEPVSETIKKKLLALNVIVV